MRLLFFKATKIFALFVLILLYIPIQCCAKDALTLSSRYKGYNVILIICDALRPDHLSCYGYNKKTSPNIDLIAKEGIIFTNVFSQGTITLPCVASIVSSLYPFCHNMLYIFRDELPKEIITLPEILNIYGYKNIWFGPLKDPHTGLSKSLLRGFTKELYFLLGTEDKIFNYIQENSNKPFFIAIHSYQTHEGTFPYKRFTNDFSVNISEAFLKEIDELKNSIKSKIEIYKSFKDWKYDAIYTMQFDTYMKGINLFDNNKTLEFLALLDSSIYEMDKKLIGGLIAHLKKLNLYEKTIIIITADHSNEYKEHGYIGHGNTLYDESIRVPLIFYLPGLKNGFKKGNLVQNIDIMPTVLDLLGIPISHQIQGISLREIMENKKNALTNKYVLSYTYGLLSIRLKRWKLIVRLNNDLFDSNSRLEDVKSFLDKDMLFKKELFDLKRDPYERNNLILKKPRIAKYLKACLKSKISNLHSYQGKNNEFLPELDEQTKKKIITTGYW